MSNSRFSIFHTLPRELEEKIYAYLPPTEIINSRQDVRSHPLRMRALFSNESEKARNLQKRLLNCWVRYPHACPLDVRFLNSRLISTPNFYDAPLHYQLSVLALHNALLGKKSNFTVINAYAEYLLSLVDVFSHGEYVVFFKQAAALLSSNNQYDLAVICLEEMYQTAKTTVKFLLCDLSLYLQEDQILTILLDDVFLLKLRSLAFRSTRCAFSDVVIKLINALSDENKIKVIRRFLDYFSENNETPENIFYLLSSFIDGAANTSVAADNEYQCILAKIADSAPAVLKLKANKKNFPVIESETLQVLKSIFMASSSEAIKVKILKLFRRMIPDESPKLLCDSVYEVIWNAAVEEGDHIKAIELFPYLPRLNQLNWSQLIEEKIIDWLSGKVAVNSHYLLNKHLKKIIMKIINLSNLARAINIFVEVNELHAPKNILDDSFWRSFRSFFRHPGVDHLQRQRLLDLLTAEINRGVHSFYFILPLHGLEVAERGHVFSAVLARNTEEPSSSLMDALCKMSIMSLPVDLIEGYVATLIKFLLSRTEKKLPASINELYSSIINLSRQSLSDSAAKEVLALLDNDSISCKKFILLKSFFASNGLYKHWGVVFRLLKTMLYQEDMPSDDIFNAFKKYAYLVSRENPGVLVEYIDFFMANLESINMAAGLSMLKYLTDQPLVQPALLKCIGFLFPNRCSSPMFDKMRSDILMNLAKHSCLPVEHIPAFFDYAKECLKVDILEQHIEAFDLMGWLLQQINLPLLIQKEIQDSAFAKLHSDCPERILSAVLLLKAWHKAGWSVDFTIAEIDQCHLFELTNHVEEQIRNEVISLLNALPGIAMTFNSFANPESILLIAIQQERGLLVKQEISPSKASSSHVARV